MDRVDKRDSILAICETLIQTYLDEFNHSIHFAR